MTPYIIVLIVIPAVLLALELGLMIRDGVRGKGTTTSDKGTRLLNFLAISIGIGAAAGLASLRGADFPGAKTGPVLFAGAAVALAGMLLRYWSVFTLGASFRTTIETDRDQKVVSTGPYRLLRHPSYSGLLLVCLGYGLSVQNWLSLLAAFLLPLIALLYRIQVEEKILAAALGAEYLAYQKRTKRLVPWIW